MEIALSMLFQYNFCYCSIEDAYANGCLAGMFQYNFCYCSMWKKHLVLWGNRIVSIQLLLLFYPPRNNDYYNNGIGFNTTFVTVLWTTDQYKAAI